MIGIKKSESKSCIDFFLKCFSKNPKQETELTNEEFKTLIKAIDSGEGTKGTNDDELEIYGKFIRKVIDDCCSEERDISIVSPNIKAKKVAKIWQDNLKFLTKKEDNIVRIKKIIKFVESKNNIDDKYMTIFDVTKKYIDYKKSWDITDELVKVKNELSELEVQKAKYLKELKEKESELLALTTKTKNLNEELIKVTAQKVKEFKKKENELSELTTKTKNANEELTKLKAQKVLEKYELKSIKSNKESQLTLSRKIKSKNNNLENEHKELKARIEDLEKKVEKLNKEKFKLEKDNKDKLSDEFKSIIHGLRQNENGDLSIDFYQYAREIKGNNSEPNKGANKQSENIQFLSDNPKILKKTKEESSKLTKAPISKFSNNEIHKGKSGEGLSLSSLNLNLKHIHMSNIRADLYINREIIGAEKVLDGLLIWLDIMRDCAEYTSILSIQGHSSTTKHAIFLHAKYDGRNTHINLIDPLSKGDSEHIEHIHCLKNSLNSANDNFQAKIIYSGIQNKDYASKATAWQLNNTLVLMRLTG